MERALRVDGAWTDILVVRPQLGLLDPAARESIYWICFTENLLENTDGGTPTRVVVVSVFSWDGSTLPFSSADVRSPGDVIAF